VNAPQATKVTFKDVLNPKVPRPPRESELRHDYDQTFRCLVHLAMIFAGVIVGVTMAGLQCSLITITVIQGILPSGIQEACDYLFKF
jgi:hypothetical protein